VLRAPSGYWGGPTANHSRSKGRGAGRRKKVGRFGKSAGEIALDGDEKMESESAQGRKERGGPAISLSGFGTAGWGSVDKKRSRKMERLS